MTIRIIGTGVGTPQRALSNDELAAVAGLDTSDEWITSRTGIRQRYICQDETLADLATDAARGALSDSGATSEQVDYLICATIGGDTRTPSLACVVAERLGATCMAMDINVGCVGFLGALDIAANTIQSRRAKRVLIICAEKMSAHLDWSDRGTCVLFGDAAAACMVTSGRVLKYINLGSMPDSKVISMRSDMVGCNPLAHSLEPASYVQMNGQQIFKYGVTIIEQEMRRTLDALQLTFSDIDLFLIHQANRRIIDFAIRRLEQPKSKFPIIIDRYGNTSAVSLPLMLHELRQDGRIHPGQRLFLCAYGSGLIYGSCVLEWE